MPEQTPYGRLEAAITQLQNHRDDDRNRIADLEDKVRALENRLNDVEHKVDYP